MYDFQIKVARKICRRRNRRYPGLGDRSLTQSTSRLPSNLAMRNGINEEYGGRLLLDTIRRRFGRALAKFDWHVSFYNDTPSIVFFYDVAVPETET